MTPEKTFKLLPPYRYRLLDSKGHVDVITRFRIARKAEAALASLNTRIMVGYGMNGTLRVS